VGPVHEDGVAVVETQTIRAGRGDLLELHRKRVGRRRRSIRKNQRTGGDSRGSVGKRLIRFFQPILYIMLNLCTLVHIVINYVHF